MKKQIKGYFLLDGVRVNFEFDSLNRMKLYFKERKVFLKTWLREDDLKTALKKAEEMIFEGAHIVISDEGDGKVKVLKYKGGNIYEKRENIFSNLLQKIRDLFREGESKIIIEHLKKMQQQKDYREICINFSINTSKFSFSYPEPIKKV